MTCALIETSSAETASSATISFGASASARAMHDALALAAGELVRKAARHVGLAGRPCAAARQPVPRVGLAVGDAVHEHRLGDRAPTVLRGLRLAIGSWKIICMRWRAARSRARSRSRDILPFEQDGAADRLDQAQDRAPRRRLAAAGFADQRQRLAARRAKRHILDRVHARPDAAEHAGAGCRSGSSVGDFEQRALGGADRRRRRPAARRSRRSPDRRSESAAGRRGPSWSRAAAPRRAARACRAAAACAKERRRSSPSSTLSPCHMTTTRSAISATTPMSWVMNRTAMPSSSCSILMSSRICAWIVTSSAVVGSSAISSCGRQASAMAIITRWRMPPENRCGYSCRRALRGRNAHALQHAHRLGLGRGAVEPAMVDERLRDLEADGQHRIEARHRLLEDHGDPVAAHLAHLLLGKVEEVAALEQDLARDAAVDRRHQPHDRQRGDALARAGFADHRHGSRRLRCRTRHRRRPAARPHRRGTTSSGSGSTSSGGCCRGAWLDIISPLSFGSMASRSPSPSRFSANTTTRMAMPGTSASQALSRMFSKPSRIMPPQVGRRRLDAQPDEGERGLGADRVGEPQRAHHQDLGKDVRQHVQPIRCAHRRSRARGRPRRIRAPSPRWSARARCGRTAGSRSARWRR